MAEINVLRNAVPPEGRGGPVLGLSSCWWLLNIPWLSLACGHTLPIINSISTSSSFMPLQYIIHKSAFNTYLEIPG
jgi:hypothetical protein